MIKQIQEINFPSYATLSSATVTLNDMGDKTITAQVKIDGGETPDFSYDWEVEFQGERYIQPLREPQASKGNESICSLIDLTFYHKTIYDLKRYFFVEMASTGSGTAMADKYIADLNVNIEQFKVALQDVLDFYYKDENRIIVSLYGEDTDIYAKEPQYVQIQYTHIWDVVQKIYDLFGVRWAIEGREIKIGYPSREVSHIFKYGYEGGLLRVERQVQSADIRNSLLGRGSSKNLPYRYFKDTDPENPLFPADPDWIPELANIYFTELRGKTFRDYVKGWKAKHYGGAPMSEPTEAYTKGYTDTKFNPIEYVEDKDSITKYGLLQGGLDNQEDKYPSIQGVEVEGLGRVDEVVEAEQVLVDEATEQQQTILLEEINTPWGEKKNQSKDVQSLQLHIKSDPFVIQKGCKGTLKNIKSLATCSYEYSKVYYYGTGGKSSPYKGVNHGHNLESKIISATLFYTDTNNEVLDIANLEENISYYYEADIEVYGGFPKDEDNRVVHPNTGQKLNGDVITIANEYTVNWKAYWELEQTSIPSLVVGNYTDGINRIYGEIKNLEKNTEKNIDINSEVFTVPEGGATMVDAPINIIATDNNGEDISGSYEWEKTVKVVNTSTQEVLSSINMPQGEYYARVNVRIKNNHTTQANYRIELLPSYIYFPIDAEQWQPTFDIWVKNIWGTTRNEGESGQAYVDRVWTPILGDREGNEAKVVFTTGWLAGHSDYEFTIVNVAYDTNVPNAEWRLTLAKSDAEIEATGKWIPSTQQQASVGDKFFFIGIDMPHQYVLWAEQAVDDFKRDTLLDTAHIKPTWVVQTDKVRLNQLQPNETEPLLNALKVGNSILLADIRFIEGVYEKLYLQSVTYSWDAQTSMYPNVEVVLSDKVVTTTNPVAQLQGEVDALTKQVGSLSNIQQIVRAIGDKAYLRKDGITDTSNSETTFNKPIHSRDFQQGAIGGSGWGLRIENGKAVVEADTIIARYGLQVNNLIINQVASIAGTNIISAANMECSKVEMMENAIRCYFNQRQGTISNHFALRDIAFSQVFSPDNVEVKYYKREVVGVGANYIDLSITNHDGDGAPQEGDTIVQMGNFDDTSRQGVIIIESNPVPAIWQYNGVNSFVMPAPVTKISPDDNVFTGKVHIGAGSTGVGNLNGLPEEVQKAVSGEIGNYNLIRNSGYEGDYTTAELGGDTPLDADSDMFSPRLVHWSTTGDVKVVADDASKSGYAVELTNGSIQQVLDDVLIANEKYILSFKAKGTVESTEDGTKEGTKVKVSRFCNGVTIIETFELNNEFKTYDYLFEGKAGKTTITFEGNGIGNATICELQLERGSIRTAWSKSYLDNSKELAEMQAFKYLSNAIREGSTNILGGLILSNMIMLGNYVNGTMKNVTAGVSGTYADDQSVAFWGGGTYEQAISTVVKMMSGNKAWTEDMANFVVTHGGDIFLRGYINALGGIFRGDVFIDGGNTKLNSDGSGQLAKGNISWDSAGRLKRKSPDTDVWINITECIEGTITVDGVEMPRIGYSKGCNINLTLDANYDGNKLFYLTTSDESNATIKIKGLAKENNAILYGSFIPHDIQVSETYYNKLVLDNAVDEIILRRLGDSSIWEVLSSTSEVKSVTIDGTTYDEVLYIKGGANTTFTTSDGKTVTVKNGLIVNIE